MTWIVTHWKLNGQVHHLASLQVKNVFIDNVEVSIFLLESIYFGIKRARIHICIYILLNKSLQESETFAYVSFPRRQWIIAARMPVSRSVRRPSALLTDALCPLLETLDLQQTSVWTSQRRILPEHMEGKQKNEIYVIYETASSETVGIVVS